MNNFQEISPQERGLVIAKLYHNIWYDSNRYNIILSLLKEWENEPVKEAKYLYEINESININDIIN